MSNLLVQNIKHTNGTVAQTIDSSGRTLTPARPSFFAHRTAQGNQSITGGNFTLAQLNLVEHNIGGHYNTSTYKFTCPISGVYHFSVNLYIYSANQTEARIYVNDTARYRFASVKLGADRNPHGAGGSLTIQLNANDTVSVYGYASSNADIYGGGDVLTASFFSGFLVG
tara:strand:+ start:18 stop:524 length:507 start_codon:yes stop_codon:yes gene_type:complete